MNYLDLENSDRPISELKASDAYELLYKSSFRGTRNAMLIGLLVVIAISALGAWVAGKRADAQQQQAVDRILQGY